MANEKQLREYLKRATSALEESIDRLRELEERRHEPIAIIAMSCRYPGGADTPEGLWDLLQRGGDAISDFPADRGWDVESLYDPDPAAQGKTYTRWGGFLHEAPEFDAGFFGISPREALAIDPQHRLLLETSWEALERAGIAPASLLGSSTGVFVGIIYNDYGMRILRAPAGLEGYLGTGSAPSVASGRIAYTLGLQGPAISIDTACSSSLVAVHLACQALRQGECGLALAGGVTMMSTPAVFVEFSRQRGLSRDGRCKAFSARADGTGWSEGVGMLVLERLSDARRNGHRVLALVRGSAINQDGRSQGLTAPNGPSQQQLILQALRNAKLSATDIEVVEGHGTGTTLGDPIEAQALIATYGKDRVAEHPLWLGSIKSNLGHTQAAAGVAGIIKMVLAMEHSLLPKTLHAEEASPHVDWSSGTVRLLSDARPWARNGHLRRAGVSSFGVSGTNAHVILEEAPPADPADTAATGSEVGAVSSAALCDEALPFVLSGKSESALAAQARRLAAHVEARPELALADIAHSLATTRTHFEQRAVVIAREHAALLASLQALGAGEPAQATAIGRANVAGKVVFVFPGQGSQWPQMAQGLLASSPEFRASIEACDRAFAEHVDWSLLAVLAGQDSAPSLERVDVVQPALFAVMVSLAQLWRSLGVKPDAVIGHSQGEIAAAYIAGALSLGDAARVVTLRARALMQLSGQGAMAAVELSSAATRERIAPYADSIAIAAINSPVSTLVSGEPGAIERLLAELSEAQVFARAIRVDYASHCEQVEAIREELERSLQGIAPGRLSLPMYSTVTGAKVEPEELDAGYWYRNLRQTVRFADAVEQLLADGHRFFVEVSPHPVLSLALQENAHAADTNVAIVGTLRRDQGGAERVLLSLGELHVRGLGSDWKPLLPAARPVPLPTYAFERQRYWLDAGGAANGDVSSAGLLSAEHPLLGASIAVAEGDNFVFTGRLSLATHAWLGGHVVFGAVLLPGSAFVELALAAAQRVGLDTVDELTLEAPLVVPERGALQLQVLVGALDENKRRSLSVHARAADNSEGGWTRHASGVLSAAESVTAAELRDWPPAGAVAIELDGLYERAAEAGLRYSDAFCGLRAVYRRGEELFAQVELPEAASLEASRFGLHPALLDAALHALLTLQTPDAGIALPFIWNGVQLCGRGASALRVRLSGGEAQGGVSVLLADAAGEPVGAVEALHIRPAVASQIRGASVLRDALYRVDWVTLPTLPVASSAIEWAWLGDVPEGLPTTPSSYADLGTLQAWLAQGHRAPALVVLACLAPASASEDTVSAAHQATQQLLGVLQGVLRDERLAHSRVVVVTRRAVATHAGEDVLDLARAPLWGLVRSAQSEHPGRLTLLDIDTLPVSEPTWQCALGSEEPQLGLRQDKLCAPRLARARADELLVPEDGAPWSLQISSRGSLDNLVLVPTPEITDALSSGQVRIAVHVAGLNFRDVLNTLGMYPGEAGPPGNEGAGVVLEVGPDVSLVAVGDRVMGLFPAAFGPVVVTDQRAVVRIPAGLSFEQAAGIPVVFLTAYYGLFELARLQRNERVLIHAAAGGVGMAAVQLAQHVGAEIFATASPGKWGALRALGIAETHIASSRELGFESRVLGASIGRGVDVVLNSLAGEFVDASLRLLLQGGRFVEMGKTDVREPSTIAAAYPAVAYRAFELGEAGLDRIQQMLVEVGALFERGVLRPLPTRSWDVRRAPEALRFVAQARHVGKVVLTIPRQLDPSGTVLITGGTGTLGGLVARHLVARHGVRHLLLCSRGGGAEALQQELAAAGACVRVAACDVSDRGALGELLAGIDAEHPLTAVIHMAGVIDDGVFDAMGAERIDKVFAPKVDAAWYLHELTRERELAAFVLFSSMSGVLGAAGQANYAAANTFVDALAHHRCAQGLPACALAWGYWAQRSGMTGHLGAADMARMQRAGMMELSSEEGLSLFDMALCRAAPLLVPARVDMRSLSAVGESLPPLLQDLVRAKSRAFGATLSGLKQRLAGLSAAERERLLLELVRSTTATVLSASIESVEPERPLRELGLDSLMAVELRNRLQALVGIHVSVASIFEKTSQALAKELIERWTTHGQSVSSTQPAVALPPDTYAPFPLTPIQQAYWVGRQMGPAGGVAYHSYREVEGPIVNLQHFETSWRAVIARHEALRMIFTSDGHQRLLPKVPDYALPIEDLRLIDGEQRERRLTEFRAELSSACRSLEKWPLFDFRIFLLPGGRARYCMDFDLVCLDGASLRMVLSDWRRLYEDPGLELPQLTPRGFEAVVRAGIASRGSDAHRRSLAFWQGRRPSFDPIPQLPLATSPDRLQRHSNVRYAGRLNAVDWSQFCFEAQSRGVTAAIALCAAFVEILAYHSGDAPFLLNVTHFHRPQIHPNINDIAGDFTNLLFLECRRTPGNSLRTLAVGLQQQLHELLEHSAVDGVEVLRAWRQVGGEVVAPVVFTSLLGLPGADAADEWLGEPLFQITQTPQVWLDHITREARGELHFTWDVIDGLFPDGLIDEMMAAYTARITSLARDPAAWDACWPLLLSQRHQSRIAIANDTARSVPQHTLHGLFAAKAASQPDRPAVITRACTLTYGALDAMAREIGSRLRELGVKPNSPVAVVMDKGWEQVAAVLGTLYSGAAYVPIDASLPDARLRLLLERSGASVALIQPGVHPPGVKCLVIDGDLPQDPEAMPPLEFVQTPTDLAYIIYTSGSTGDPKGVMLDHRGPVNYLLDINECLDVGPTDRAFGLSSLSFDLSVYDMFGMFAAGGALVLPDAADRGDPAAWTQYLRQGVTVWNSVPALLGLLLEYAKGRPDITLAMGSLSKVMLSGDWIPVGLPDALRSEVPEVKVISVGGATETSINAILFAIDRVAPTWPSIPWGKPMANQNAWILHPSMEPCPLYVPGEIYVGGIGLAQGYWRDEERTKESFIVHPRTGKRLYRTGDWGRWLPTGDIEFLGRRDQQVKIHGYRVELGDIEAALERHADVQQAVAVAIGDREKRLVAHVVLERFGEGVFAESVPLCLQSRMQSEAVLLQDLAARRAYVETILSAPTTPCQDETRTILLPDTQSSLAFAAKERTTDASPSLESLAAIVEVLRRVPNAYAPQPKARYASAGSLYPVQLLLVVAKDRIAELAGGIYYYHPIEHTFVRLSDRIPLLLKDVSGQEGLLEGAGFAFVLIGRLAAIAPLYGPLSERFSTLEAGAMCHLLECSAIEQGIRLRSVVGLQLDASEPAFGLGAGNIFLHAMAGGNELAVRDDAEENSDAIVASLGNRPAVDLSGFALLQNARERLNFKMEDRALLRSTGPSIALPRRRSEAEFENQWVSRRSFRTYEPSTVSLQSLAGLLSILRPTQDGLRLRFRSFSYRSESPLYPVQLCVFVKSGRVDGLEGGVYRFDPVENTLLRSGAPIVIDAKRIPPHNRSMFEDAAFVIFVVGHVERIAPLFGAQSEHLCLVEAGRICQVLEDAASANGVGLCQVGFDFRGYDAVFHLRPGEIGLHALVGGVADWSGRRRGWAFLAEAAPPIPKATDAAALRAYCEKVLPAYMVPSHIQVQQSLPLNANGKVDRAALKKQTSQDSPAVRSRVAPPFDGASESSIAELTEVVSRVAAEVFELPEVPADAVLADLGLDSLLALRFRDRLGRALGRSLPATLVYDYPTVAAIVHALTPAFEVASPRFRTEPGEPIAIVGMACRTPGAVIDAADYWALLMEGRDAIGPFPERWDVEALYDPDPDARGKSYAREGGFLRDVDQFDAAFFGISPREAAAMDPQQRLVLEMAWEALEQAGLRPGELKESSTGVYLGSMGSDYGHGSASLHSLDGYIGTGQASSVLSGRVSYVLNLQGPAMTVDTACSSSLVSLHLACAGLRQGECDLALAGGVQVMSTPSYFVEFSRLRGLAPDGRCKSFSANANGIGWSEGCGILVLKRLSDAKRDGDRVLAVVRGSAVNQDGRSQGLTAPNGPSQQRVIRRALAVSGLAPSDIDVIEAHGTGTALGDPVEAGTLVELFAPTRCEGEPLYLGSSKSNLGHTSAAAGVLGVMKIVLALQHEFLPKTLHAETPSGHIAWEGSGLKLLQEGRPWSRRAERMRRAGVSSFGISGTNAHVILEEAPPADPADTAATGSEVGAVSSAALCDEALPFVLSGKSESALAAQARRLAAHVEARPELALADVAHSLATTRTHFEQRAVVIAREHAALLASLQALGAGEPSAHAVMGRARSGEGKLAVLFTGQGSQRPQMGKGLYATFAVFREALDAVFSAFEGELGRPLREVMFAEEHSEEAALLDQTEFAQPALFALEVALYRLMSSWGVRPDMLVGHSIGEISAAHVAGVMSLADASKLVAARGRLMQGLPAGGAMLALSASEAELVPLLEQYTDRIDVAAVNGPQAVVVSGDEDAVLAVGGHFEAQGRRVSRLRVSHAFHSRRMEEMLEPFGRVVRDLQLRSPTVPIISNVTGKLATADELTTAEYWVLHARRTVRFYEAVQTLERTGTEIFLELGPQAVLSALVQEGLSEGAQGRARLWATLRKEQDEVSSTLTALGGLYTHGQPVEWSAFFGPLGGHKVPLPTYAFERQRYWLDAGGAANGDVSSAGLLSAEHPLLGASIAVAEGDNFVFTGRLSLATHAWLGGHVVFGAVLLPGSAFVELALAAAQRVGLDTVDELTLEAPLVVPERGALQLQVLVGALDENKRRSLSVHARAADNSEGGWTRHASGVLSAAESVTAAELRDWPPAGAVAIELDGLYERAAEAGLRYSDAFCGLRAVYRRGEELFAQVELPEAASLEASRFGLHPALLDAALHALLTLQTPDVGIALPFIWNGVQLCGRGASALRVRLSGGEAQGGVSVLLADAAGEPVGAVEALHIRPAVASQIRGASALRDALYRVDWVTLPTLPVASSAIEWAWLGDVPEGLPTTPSSYADLGTLQAWLAQGHRAPALVVLACLAPASASEDTVSAAHQATQQLLGVLQGVLRDERLAHSRVVVVTRRAVATHAGEDVLDLARAPLWGLVRSAQSEHPGRLTLLDIDTLPVSEPTWQCALGSEEPQLGLRQDKLCAPRLVREGVAAQSNTVSEATRQLDPSGTVLITGGTGTLGGLVARHLVARHGVRHLLLCSRGGGAEALQQELAAAGACVRVAACDVSDRGALGELLAGIDAEHPLTAVIHMAGVIDDGVFDAMGAERIDKVFAPKVDAAWYLHELTRERELAAFVLFSSMSGVLGAAGQANYAAANTFVDALAHHRCAQGLPACALAWGYWAQRSGMTGHLGAADMARMQRAGMMELSSEEGLSLFDMALCRAAPLLVPARVDMRSLSAVGESLPPLLQGLVRAKSRAFGATLSGLKQRLAGLSAAERERLLLELVRSTTATVLSASIESVEPERPLRELGLDSLMAVELRNRLSAASGLRLPATLLFDYPTPRALARRLQDDLVGQLPQLVVASPSFVPSAQDEPIAIIAMSCRYPGGADTPEGLWDLLQRGGDAISDFPADRGWDVESLYDPDPAAQGKTYTRWGGFLHEAPEFDAGFFGISPREALAIDPQQRLLLETSWEALERAGIAPASLLGSSTGVFVGIIYNDYGMRILRAPAGLEGYLGTGSAPSVASGRIAYTLGLQGPAISIDTACSSSLVAVHLACQALRQGECGLALAGGVTMMSTPAAFVDFSRQRGLSRDGRCKAFSARADGTGWSEGVGMLVLERLSDARRNGHRVLALVRGSAINQDGRSQGLTAPNGPSQQQLILQALRNAKLSATDIEVVEGHGTGTTLGDPIEAQALIATYGKDRVAEHPLWLGSIKSNLGHTQAAAGVAGIIKMVLAMEHSLLPKTLHAEEASPHVDWSSGTVRLLSDARPWARNGHLRRAGVSSFGVSGTNAHVILEEAPPADPADTAATGSEVGAVSSAALCDEALPFVLSGKSESALAAQARRLAAHVEARPELALADVAHSLATTRTHFEQRAVVIAREHAALLASLQALGAGEPSAHAVMGRARSGEGKLAVLFTGQGSQRPQMGKGLYATFAVFREALDAVFSAFEGELGRPLREVMFAEEHSEEAALLDQTEFAQPALFALEVALYRLMSSWGVRPDMLVGHSIGEISAAHVAGVMSLADASKLVAARGRLMQGLPAGGAMLALSASEAELVPLLEQYTDRIDVAAVNGPQAVVVSGDEDAVLAVGGHFEAQGRRVSRLRVSHAFHSRRMEEMLEPFGRVVRDLQLRSPTVPIISNVTGKLATADELTTAEYWVLHARRTVRFYEAVQTLERTGTEIFLELGPQAVLSALVQEGLSEGAQGRARLWATLRKEQDEVSSTLTALGGLYTHGQPVEWSAFFGPLGGHKVPLPTYAFERQRYWLDAGGAANGDVSSAGLLSAEHPLLGASIAVAEGDNFVFTGRLSLATHAWLGGHVVFGAVLLPGSAFVELALAAAQRVGLDTVDELTLEAPLVVPERGALQLQVLVGALDENKRRSLSVHARAADNSEGGWTRHASGVLSAAESVTAAELRDWPPAGAVAIELDGLYERAAEAGLRYSDAFCGLRAVYRRGEELFAQVELPEAASLEASRFGLHPALLDAALHALLTLQTPDVGIALPFIWNGVQLCGRGASALRVRLSGGEAQGGVSVLLADAAGEPVGAVEALHIRPAVASQIRGASALRDALYRVDWVTLPTLPVASSAIEWAWLGDVPEGLPTTPSSYADLGTLQAWLAQGHRAPALVVLACLAPASASEDTVSAAHQATQQLLGVLQGVLRDERLAHSRVVVVTRRAVATHAGEDVLDLARAPLWGLVRSAQSEHPGRLTLLDIDTLPVSEPTWQCALGSEEPQLGLRQDKLCAPRLARARADELLVPEDGAPWSLQISSRGSLDNLVLVPTPEITDALSSGQVRIAVHVAGLNFRDVLNTLGMYPGEAGPPGNEGAGVVLEVGPDVSLVAVGDRVMGLFPAAFGPVVVTDQRAVVRIPAGLSFEQAAGIPVVFLTAYYGLFELARLQRNERVLIHAAAGGVGMAAVQLAQHVGAEIFATASPGKWGALRALGIAETHIASSRELGFESRVLGASIGRGVDVVLNSLAGEFVDASLRLLLQGGRFVEMGKTDVREPSTIAAAYPAVAYRAFELGEAGLDRIQQMLVEVGALFERGVLRPLPTRSWDVRRAPEALRFVAQARHVGKVVLTIPRQLDPSGTVLITGGTGTLGGLVARHLVARHGVRHLLLCSRGGGAEALQQELAAAGACVRVAACDVSDRGALGELLAGIDAEHPLTAVIHMAGVIDDGVFDAMGAERIDKVFAPKVDAAWYLHELTRERELAAFVLFSSTSGVLGAAGQANYAAANTFVDALAHHRCAQGLPACALAWGYWAQRSGMTGHLGAADMARMQRAGMMELSSEEGLSLFDMALCRAAPLLVPARVDMRSLSAVGESLPPLLQGLVRAKSRAFGATLSGLKQRLAGLSAAERERLLLELVRSTTATVLSASIESVEPERPLHELGLDSLMAVELRNRLSAASGLRLPATLLFDYPTAKALTELLAAHLFQNDATEEKRFSSSINEIDRLETFLFTNRSSIDAERVATRLRSMLSRWIDANVNSPPLLKSDLEANSALAKKIDMASNNELFELVDQTLDGLGFSDDRGRETAS